MSWSGFGIGDEMAMLSIGEIIGLDSMHWVAG